MDEEARTELNIIIEGLTPRDRTFILALELGSGTRCGMEK